MLKSQQKFPVATRC